MPDAASGHGLTQLLAATAIDHVGMPTLAAFRAAKCNITEPLNPRPKRKQKQLKRAAMHGALLTGYGPRISLAGDQPMSISEARTKA